MTARSNPEAISPTAHFTAQVWFANGLSNAAFTTPLGRAMYTVVRPGDQLLDRAGVPTLEAMLLARHRAIDAIVERAIAAGADQVIEIAAGLSPRGWRFRERHGDRITYIEADLPGMRARKQRILAALGGETAHHYTVEIDALADTGAASLDALCTRLDPRRGVVLVTEGLVNYFDRATTIAMWERFARALAGFPQGHYVSDLVVARGNRGVFERAFSLALSAFVRGRVHMHFRDTDDAAAALYAAGFARADLVDPGSPRVRIIDATR